MRNCRANTYKLWYCILQEQEELYDENGDYTGEFTNGYADPVFFRANISPSRGESWEAHYGLNFQYENILSTAEMDLPIDENTLIFEKKPETPIDPALAVYKVVGVYKGHMHMRYALRKMRHESE